MLSFLSSLILRINNFLQDPYSFNPKIDLVGDHQGWQMMNIMDALHSFGLTARFAAGEIISADNPGGDVELVPHRLLHVFRHLARSGRLEEVDGGWRATPEGRMLFRYVEPNLVGYTYRGIYHNMRRFLSDSTMSIPDLPHGDNVDNANAGNTRHFLEAKGYVSQTEHDRLFGYGCGSGGFEAMVRSWRPDMIIVAGDFNDEALDRAKQTWSDKMGKLGMSSDTNPPTWIHNIDVRNPQDAADKAQAAGFNPAIRMLLSLMFIVQEARTEDFRAMLTTKEDLRALLVKFLTAFPKAILIIGELFKMCPTVTAPWHQTAGIVPYGAFHDISEQALLSEEDWRWAIEAAGYRLVEFHGLNEVGPSFNTKTWWGRFSKWLYYKINKQIYGSATMILEPVA